MSGVEETSGDGAFVARRTLRTISLRTERMARSMLSGFECLVLGFAGILLPTLDAGRPERRADHAFFVCCVRTWLATVMILILSAAVVALVWH